MLFRENKMTSKELNLKLLEKIPKIKELYEAEVSWQEGNETGSHIVFEDVLVPFIKEQLKNGNEVMLREVFVFIEELLIQKDEYASEVVEFSVIESLTFDEEIKSREYMKYLGANTARIVAEITNS